MLFPYLIVSCYAIPEFCKPILKNVKTKRKITFNFLLQIVSVVVSVQNSWSSVLLVHEKFENNEFLLLLRFMKIQILKVVVL